MTLHAPTNGLENDKFRLGVELFGRQVIICRLYGTGAARLEVEDMIKETTTPREPNLVRRRGTDGLGPNSDIGMRLRALYGAVQDEGIPDKLLDLLERLDEAEKNEGRSNATGR